MIFFAIALVLIIVALLAGVGAGLAAQAPEGDGGAYVLFCVFVMIVCIIGFVCDIGAAWAHYFSR